ncbi:hypothetical protein SAMN04489761_3418 [Tenacibaculum sp. MAR_2009_124]|uniref:hypothetical protein n=1 Tax=Tenacibaculum sp. MAR_2009_124 TaxID=1250059 RepID=UPI0008948E87|nr:hypothetical protein [Tenacibaculum sp. MAR_2009_124]SEC65731.1 hypothetical protein SAMN04489761_3418 [Tenacibaculum sp. MAR_2009_124]
MRYRQFLIIIFLIVIGFSCKKENSPNSDSANKAVSTSNESSFQIPNNIDEMSPEEAKSFIKDFLNQHETVTNESYETFYKVFIKFYFSLEDKSKYNSIIHLAKKTLKNREDLGFKNDQYKDLKKELLKLI